MTRTRRLAFPALVGILVFGTCLRADDRVSRYGTATPGSGDIAPTVWVNTTPRHGDANFRLRVERALGGTWGFPFYAGAAADFSFGGVRFLIDPSVSSYGGAYFLAGQGDGGGSGDIPLPLPNNPGLVGATLFVQVFTLDDFAGNRLGLAATTGLRLRPAMAGALLVARAVAGSPDAQATVELLPNRVVQFGDGRVIDGRSVALAQEGAVVLTLDAGADRLRVFDYANNPPRFRSDVVLPGEGTPQRVAVTPDGSRAYVLHESTTATSVPTPAYDVRDRGSFGQAWPGPTLRLTDVPDARAMVFGKDGASAFVAAHGRLPARPGSVSRVDVQPGSATFHQQTARLQFVGFLVTDLAIAPDGQSLYVPLLASGRSELAVVDVATFTVRDMDDGAAGVQNLGGEVSRPRTALPPTLRRIAVDPRGEEVYCGTIGAIVRVTVAPDSPRFRQVVTTTDNIPAGDLVGAVLVSDAGDFVYATTSLRVIEIETVRLWSLRGWSLTGAVDMVLR